MWSLPWIAANIWSALARAVLIAEEDAAERAEAIAAGTYWEEQHEDNFRDPDLRSGIWGDQ